MKRLLILLLSATGVWAGTIVSGSATYDRGIVPYNSDTSFNLTLSGSPFSSFDVSHIYQMGAKGASDQNYTQNFTFQPIPAQVIGTIGIQTPFSVVLNGIDYAQGYQAPSGSVVPPDGSVFSVQISLAPISGTNVLEMTQNSTATGLFALTGSLSATINGATYTDLFSGFATFNGSYNTDPRPFTNAPQLMEQYTFSATAPEPATWAVMLVGLGILGISRVNGRP